MAKLNCGPTSAEIEAARAQWHKWFAWFPVRVGSHDCRWLETVERKSRVVRGEGGGDDYWVNEYRAL